ncbi:MAG: benzoyl-CoA-dihydrodiol lyase [Ectothiorhodospiraceae bacterium]|nr:benzoyl-CoA-dihydrodiol lyase [Ectothiorhodospiraceae bacterium]MCH8503765.1 2,3-epoxybenzoyl-CoA dihydrolase [Ectothiorhodospiraceae bacterium]
MIDFQTSPDQYRHWKLQVEGETAWLRLDVSETGTLFDGYELKLNSYDLGVDIELNDAIQRLRFEHPEVKSVVVCSAKEKIFCAGANIRMLGGATHGHKVNFCKFTNETRNSIEDATDCSSQKYLCAINGTAAGGGYELALATDYIVLADDGSSTVSLPEVPLLAVLPGTGGLTRVVDKRKVRRDLADVFCSTEEGVRGQRAVDWRLVDECVPTSRFLDRVRERAAEMAAESDRPSDATGVKLSPLQRQIAEDTVRYSHVTVELNRQKRIATVTLRAPTDAAPGDIAGMEAQGDRFWALALCRELDDAILHLRTNEATLGTIVFRSEGDPETVVGYDRFLHDHADHWLAREIMLYWKRTLKRVDLTSRTLYTQVTPRSCFAGFLAELVFAADRSYMLDGVFEDEDPDAPPATLTLTASSFGPLPMSNGLTRLQTRFLGEPDSVEKAQALVGKPLDAQAALDAGLVTYAPDDIDWEDEVRLALEERASFSPDSLTGMEANLRFAGPETMETKIFGRLTAWQNWIFQRPNAVAERGALRLYGTGERAEFNHERV